MASKVGTTLTLLAIPVLAFFGSYVIDQLPFALLFATLAVFIVVAVKWVLNLDGGSAHPSSRNALISMNERATPGTDVYDVVREVLEGPVRVEKGVEKKRTSISQGNNRKVLKRAIGQTLYVMLFYTPILGIPVLMLSAGAFTRHIASTGANTTLVDC